MTDHPAKTTDAAGPGPRRKRINLALQGGGAHGAFTWGVLDWLLEDDRIDIDGISGTSAGAMNAVALASGYHAGGSAGAREMLHRFWSKVSEHALLSPIRRSPLDMMLGQWSLDFSPSFLAFDLMSRFASPYEFNPLNINPLREVVEQVVDFEAVRACDGLRLFLAATNVHSGKIRIFSGKDITLDAVMASACLPQMFQAVEIDGVPYWDGGYMGNPPLYPLFYETRTADTVLIQINPVVREETPRTAREIVNRLNEITFNSTLLREMRSIEFVSRLIREGKLSNDAYMDVRLHRIDGEMLKPLQASSKVNAEWAFLEELFRIGRETAAAWVERNFDSIGHRSTIDLRSEFE
ncbi:patatin-like phospholipase family protein [Microvirga tunisiensis]|uniref:Patatin-like phospholipase family protein n=2 Tax=Pannonibacter tanglangensis TaxID=2750084 RepID=A0ABW9ZLR3_9HYPH|nr:MULTISPECIES: patatin-like phospholipase family protein [unclassified Pannonibacter]NBN65862.1 patatin-like phospholipase family protein [Pannonibacter sp. XCT-34]NBN80380.1 patatin-like phospholipase family protein [Pannonibacter sp. XCT-53]